MPGENTGAAAIPAAESGAILSGPDDSIFDDIFDWIANAVSNIVSSITSWIRSMWSSITSAVSSWASWVVSSLVGFFGNIISWVQTAISWIQSTYSLVRSWISSAWSTVYGAVSSAIGQVASWISSAWSSAYSWISSHLSQLWSWISGGLSNLWGSISSWFTQLWSNLSSWWSSLWGGITAALSQAVATITSTLGTIIDQVNTALDWLTTWLDENVVKPLATWWDKFLDRILDFPAWVGKLFDSVSAWLTVDVPGHSPRWTAIFEGIGHWFATWFYEFPKWFFGDFPENVAYGLAASWDWFTRGLQPVVATFMDALVNYTSQLKAIHPNYATQHYTNLITVGATAVFGLVGMTIAGELLHPLKNLGLGNIAAMIFDLTNYKMLTGAFMTALGTAAIGLPMRWYYYRLFRPQLPGIRDGMDFYASDDITEAAFREFLGYHGIPDGWHDAYVSSAYRAPSPYQLLRAAESGTVDEAVIEAELRRGGYHPDVRKMYLDAARKTAAGQVKAIMVSSATGRYKKGYTTADELTAELRLLNVGDQLIPSYLAGARLDAATAYLDDLIDAYTYAVRAGNMGLEDYRDALLKLGIIPDRVAAYVLRERARIKPKEPLTQIGTPEKIYLTDSGKLQLETIRIRRTKNTITRAQELNELLALGIDTAYASAIADNDDVHLLEKIDIEPPKVLPVYKTDAGKIQVDTIRDARRKSTIDRVGELTQLAALGVPEYLAEAMAGNDDVALEEKIPTGAAPAPPAYETEAGKVKVDTIRRNRRLGNIEHEEEVGQLLALDMPEWLAEAIAENDDLRIRKSAGGE